jgi:hypothetical protein
VSDFSSAALRLHSPSEWHEKLKISQTPLFRTSAADNTANKPKTTTATQAAFRRILPFGHIIIDVSLVSRSGVCDDVAESLCPSEEVHGGYVIKQQEQFERKDTQILLYNKQLTLQKEQAVIHHRTAPRRACAVHRITRPRHHDACILEGTLQDISNLHDAGLVMVPTPKPYAQLQQVHTCKARCVLRIHDYAGQQYWAVSDHK